MDPAVGEQTGTYITGGGITAPSAVASDPENHDQLWVVSAKLVGVDPDWP